MQTEGDILLLLNSVMHTVSTGQQYLSGCLEPGYSGAELTNYGLVSQKAEKSSIIIYLGSTQTSVIRI